MDLLHKGAKWLEKTRDRYAARKVVYRRGSSSVTVSSTPSRTLYEYDTADGLRTNLRISDELILVDRLMLDGVRVQPQPGDQIIVGGQESGQVYEVMSPNTTEPCWRFADNYEITYRIHTKLLGNVDEQ